MPLLGTPAPRCSTPASSSTHVPYAWGARLYVIAHVLLACAAMMVLLRSWRVSRTGSSIARSRTGSVPRCSASIATSFFWSVPRGPRSGLRAVDRIVRLRRRWGVVELAGVLALQTLGGDPEAAYLIMMCGAVYALGLARGQCRVRPEEPSPAAAPGRLGLLGTGFGLTLAILMWSAGTLLAATWVKSDRKWLDSLAQSQFRPSHQVTLSVGWACAAVFFWAGWRRRPAARALIRSLAALLGASAMAAGLCSAQLLPVLEFSRLSIRADDAGASNMFLFSVEPYRVVEVIWPFFFGATAR